MNLNMVVELRDPLRYDHLDADDLHDLYTGFLPKVPIEHQYQEPEEKEEIDEAGDAIIAQPTEEEIEKYYRDEEEDDEEDQGCWGMIGKCFPFLNKKSKK